MRYEKVVEQWNSFCVDSGIRAHCQNTCKGKCCKVVSDSFRDYPGCGRKCDKSIPCILFLCDRIRGKLSPSLRTEYSNYASGVSRKVRGLTKRGVSHWGHEYARTVKWPDGTELIAKLLAVDFKLEDWHV